MDNSNGSNGSNNYTYSALKMGGTNHYGTNTAQYNNSVGRESMFSGEDIVFTDKQTCVYGSVCGILTFLIIITLACLNFVAYDQYALERNRFGTVYKDPVLTQGAYVLFPIYRTVYFPSTLTKVHFNSTVFSDAGLEFIMEIQYYYKLRKDKVYDIYNKFSYSYDLRVESNSKKTIKNLAAMFSVTQFLQNRTGIEKTLAHGVYVDLVKEIGVISPPRYFKITNIIFPQNILDNSLKSAIALQKIQLQTNQQYVNVVIADTQLLIAEINANTTAILQNSVSDSNKIMTSAGYEYENIINSARSAGIQRVSTALSFTCELTDQFVQVMALYDNANKTIFRDMANEVIVNNN